MKNQSINTKDIVTIAIIAVLYIVLTFAVPAMGFGPIQFRVSELLNFLVVSKKKYTIGVILGVVIANFFSPYFLDIVFGTGHTILSFLLCIGIFKFVTNKKLRYATVIAVFSTLMVIIAYEIAFLEGDLSLIPELYGTLFLSEAIILAIGAPIMYYVEKQLHKMDLL